MRHIISLVYLVKFFSSKLSIKIKIANTVKLKYGQNVYGILVKFVRLCE